jgi:hypothetical protein
MSAEAIEILITNAIHTARSSSTPKAMVARTLITNGSRRTRAFTSPRPSFRTWRLTGIRS